jgi:hypothetical protein
MVIAFVTEIMRLTGFPPKTTARLTAPVHLQAPSEDGKRVADFPAFSAVCGTVF